MAKQDVRNLGGNIWNKIVCYNVLYILFDSKLYANTSRRENESEIALRFLSTYLII